MRSKLHLNGVWAALLVLGSARLCYAVACNDTITTAETLTADLSCPTSPALTIGAGGSLDMNGYRVTCNGSSTGIIIFGDGASLSNGSVGNCSSTAIDVTGDRQKITGVYTFNSGAGISSSGATHLKIKDVAAAGVSFAGISVSGVGNSMSGISVMTSGNIGVYVNGDDTKLKDVTVASATSGGAISIFGERSKISDARLADGVYGINSSGNGSKFSNVHTVDYTTVGISLAGNGGKLTGSTAATSSSSALSIYNLGTTGSLSKNTTVGGLDGIQIGASSSKVSSNLAFDAQQGIHATGGIDNKISGNAAIGSSVVDLIDVAPNCEDGNIWKNNIGKTTQACIE